MDERSPDHPRNVVCPNCNAQIDKPCTQPTDDGRRIVRWYHFAREEAAEQEAAGK